MGYILRTCHHNAGDNLFAESYHSGVWSYLMDGGPMEYLPYGIWWRDSVRTASS